MSERKISDVFRENQECIQEWLANFEYEFSKKSMDLMQSGFDYQNELEILVMRMAT